MPESLPPLRIGDLARQTGLTVEALRYYERIGLLPLPERSAGGFRCYAPEVVTRVQFIKRAQSLGLSLEEIGSVVGDGSRSSDAGCRHVHDILTRHIVALDQRLSELHDIRNTLNNYRHRCEAALSTHADLPCPAVAALESSGT